MRKIFNSIDIGTDEVKLVTAELYNGKYNILCSTSVKTSGVRQGLIVNLVGITNSIKKCVRLAENKLGTKIDKVIAVIPSQNISFDIVTGKSKVTTEDGTVDGKAIFNSIGNAIKSKITNETEIVTTNPIEYKLDNKTKVKDALGLKAKEISSRVVISSVPKKNVYSVVNILENLGIEVIDICFSSIGNYYAIKTPELDSKVVAMVDIGEEKTNVAILNKGVMIKESILPFGGNVLDDEIAFNYKTKDADSRKIKEEFAVVNRKYADVDENYKCINRINQEVIINQYRLAEILEKKAVEMLKSIKNEINNLTKREIGYIIITGGITTMQGFNTIVEELFVRNATVMNLGIIGIRNNKYACSYGVIKYFVEKLDLREKKYTMYGDEKIEEIMSTRKKKGATGVLGKVFDKIFD